MATVGAGEANQELGETKGKSVTKEAPVVQDEGFFKHFTGDTYDGCFEAKKKDMSIKMNGPGTYTTAEGDRYCGNWEADRLGANQKVTITFTDSSQYEGLLNNWFYTGVGRYCYPDGSILEANFVENCPTGNLALTDPNEHTWLGRADQGFGWFEPVNHFYSQLAKTKPRVTKPTAVKRKNNKE